MIFPPPGGGGEQSGIVKGGVGRPHIDSRGVGGQKQISHWFFCETECRAAKEGGKGGEVWLLAVSISNDKWKPRKTGRENYSNNSRLFHFAFGKRGELKQRNKFSFSFSLQWRTKRGWFFWIVDYFLYEKWRVGVVALWGKRRKMASPPK